MKAIIIEDEKLVANDLQNQIAHVDDNIEIVTVLESVEDAMEWFKDQSQFQPDMIFADIQLNDGTSFDIFEKIQIKCPIIFTTAYNEYAIRAFKVNGADYLLKPVDEDELKEAIERCKLRMHNGNLQTQFTMQELVQAIRNPKEANPYRQHFQARSGSQYMLIKLDQIAFFQKNPLIYLHLKDKQQLITDFNSMEAIEEMVDPNLFFRANRQTIIHLPHIKSYKTDSFGKLQVYMHQYDDKPIDISREKAQAFKTWLGV